MTKPLTATASNCAELHGVWQRQGVLAMLRQTLHAMRLPARWLAEVGGERRLTNFLHLAELLQNAGRNAGGRAGTDPLAGYADRNTGQRRATSRWCGWKAMRTW